MVWGLLWIIGIYGTAAAVLHVLYSFQHKRKRQSRTTYIALITQDNGTQIEWYLRSLIFFSWLRGRTVTILVFDEGSTDDTLDIVGRFVEGRDHVQLADGSLEAFLEAHKDDAVMVHRVLTLGKGDSLPVLQW